MFGNARSRSEVGRTTVAVIEVESAFVDWASRMRNHRTTRCEGKLSAKASTRSSATLDRRLQVAVSAALIPLGVGPDRSAPASPGDALARGMGRGSVTPTPELEAVRPRRRREFAALVVRLDQAEPLALYGDSHPSPHSQFVRERSQVGADGVR